MGFNAARSQSRPAFDRARAFLYAARLADVRVSVIRIKPSMRNFTNMAARAEHGRPSLNLASCALT